MPDAQILRQENKVIEKITHPDGTQGVKIHLNRMEPDENDDEATKFAKEKINNEVIPKIGMEQRTVVIIHKPTNKSATLRCRERDVRKNAEKAIRDYLQIDDKGSTHDDFVIVEVPDGGIGTRVGKLQ